MEDPGDLFFDLCKEISGDAAIKRTMTSIMAILSVVAVRRTRTLFVIPPCLYTPRDISI